LIILIGPSGVGKSSFIDRLLKEESRICDITTYSTRSPRQGEVEGNPYHFVSVDRFKELVAQNFFVEWAQVHNNLYGTPWDQIRNAWAKSQVIVMDLDVQGARFFKKSFPQALTIFLTPPSLDALRQRIVKRGNVSDLDVRLKTAAEELKCHKDFDHLLVNDDFETAYRQFRFLIEKLLKNQ
jgi:guanylate kinase